MYTNGPNTDVHVQFTTDYNWMVDPLQGKYLRAGINFKTLEVSLS